MNRKILIVPLLLTAALGACTRPITNLPRGDQAYDLIPASTPETGRRDYALGPLDQISITVFQEPDLSFEKITIDASGNLVFPLIGVVQAAGKTARQLSEELAERLGQRYLRNPQVSVGVTASVSQRVTVEGNVVEPGVYELNGGTTLLEALARAKSPTRTARTNEIVIFRFIDGQRMGAVFDVTKIRRGEAPDPQIAGGDVIVVGFDAVKGAFRDFLGTAPLIAAFRPF